MSITMVFADAYIGKDGEWVYPQVYFRDKKRLSKKRLIEEIDKNMLVKEAAEVEPEIRGLLEQAKKQCCGAALGKQCLCINNII